MEQAASVNGLVKCPNLIEKLYINGSINTHEIVCLLRCTLLQQEWCGGSLPRLVTRRNPFKVDVILHFTCSKAKRAMQL